MDTKRIVGQLCIPCFFNQKCILFRRCCPQSISKAYSVITYGIMMYRLNYNNKILSPQEREEFRKLSDECITEFSASIDGIYQLAKEFSLSGNSGSNQINDTLTDVCIFIGISFCDCIVLTKLFVMATNSYEKSCLRGKLKVLLNESFKKLYGFNEKGYKDSYCAKLEQIISMFPAFEYEFRSILSDLAHFSKNSWWKEERNAEVHIDVHKLYASRHKEINESKVAMEAVQLFGIYNRFTNLMKRLNQMYINYMMLSLSSNIV